MHLGYLHDIQDVKILILFILAKVKYPVNTRQIYDLCYLDESLSYFNVCTALPEMVTSGHLSQDQDQCYALTDKGRRDYDATKDSLPFTIRRKAEDAVDRFNRQTFRSSFVKTQVDECGEEFSVELRLDDEKGLLMRLALLAPTRRQALKLSRLLDKKAETVYSLVMAELLDDEDEMEE